MPFTLGDCENDCLANLGSQNPAPNYGIGGASTYPVWMGVQGLPRFSQGLIDTAVNRSVQKILSQLRYTDLVNFSYTFASVSQIYAYPVPMGSVAQASVSFRGNPAAGIAITITVGGTAVVYNTTAADTSVAQLVSHVISALNTSVLVTTGIITLVSPIINAVNGITLTSAVNGIAGNALTLTATSSSGAVTVIASGANFAGGTATNPNCIELRRLSYQPQGQVYRRDELAGIRLVSWQEFSQATGGGYLKQFSYGTEPNLVALTPDRKSLEFFPGPSQTGDLIKLYYVPSMTTGTNQPVLVNQTDIVPLPDDLRDLVVLGAMVWLWPIANEFGMQEKSLGQFAAEMLRIREEWGRGSAGERQQIIDVYAARSMFGYTP